MRALWASLLGGLPGWLASFAVSVLNALFGQIRQGIDDARDDQAHTDVGVLRQRNADIEAEAKQGAEASDTANQARDRQKTIKGLEDGTF